MPRRRMSAFGRRARSLGMRRRTGLVRRRSFRRVNAGGRFNRSLVRRGAEIKYLDVKSDAQAVAYDAGGGAGQPMILLLNGMTQNTTASTRIGRQITMKHLFLRLRITGPSVFNTTVGATVGDARSCVRILLILDRQPNATAVTLADIFEFSTANDTQWISPINLSNRERFKVITDKTMTLNDQRPEMIRKFYKKLYKKVTYNGTNGGSIGDIQTNALYLIVVSDKHSGNTVGQATSQLPPTIWVYSRLRYYDA